MKQILKKVFKKIICLKIYFFLEEFNLQKTIDLEKNDPNLNTPNSLVSQKSDLKYNAASNLKN